MDLRTFGAALTFAIDLEGQALDALEGAACNAINTRVKDILMAFAAANKKRKAMLEKLYNDSIYSDMDAGLFEPIAGLKKADYLTNITPMSEAGYPDILMLVMDLEDKTRRFYLDLATQIKFRRGAVARNFEKMAEENSDRTLKLKSLHNMP